MSQTVPPADMVPIRDAEQFVAALNAVVELDADCERKLEALLRSFQQLLGREGRYGLWLLDQLDREPAPRIVSRTVIRPAWDPTPPQPLEALQALIDQAAPMSAVLVPRIRAQMRTPFTLAASQAGDWFAEVMLPQFLAPLGYADVIVAMWAASPARAVLLAHLRTGGDGPYASKDHTMMSLMLRAAAPIIDRDVFTRPDALSQHKLSPRQKEVLMLLLSGDSEKQVAAAIKRSVHTVHTFVRQIYDEFNVRSRGELMALFIDRAALGPALGGAAASVS